MTPVSTDLRDRLALVFDVDDLVEATRMARQLAPWFGVAKVGLELYSATGPDSVSALLDCGYRVMLDIKLHDIPTTVGRAARVLGVLGASYVTLHASGGVPMLRAGVEGLAEGAARTGLTPPVALAVTILTSDPSAPADILAKRVRNAVEARCGGVVCATADLHEIRQLAPSLVTVVPGLRMRGTATNDQARVATPRAAFDAGADLLLIGRTVTASPDRPAAAAALVESLSGAGGSSA
jgi:orotidine-5'-phosphate decarboxylase